MRKRCWKTVLSAILASAMLFTSVPTNLTMTVHAEELGVEDTVDDVNGAEDEDEQKTEDPADDQTGEQAGNETDEGQDVQNPVGEGTNVVDPADNGDENDVTDDTPAKQPVDDSEPDEEQQTATTGYKINDDMTVTFTCIASELTFKDWNNNGAIVAADDLKDVVAKGGKVGGDWDILAKLTKGDNNVWTGTSESPLAPGKYNYKFAAGANTYEAVDGDNDKTRDLIIDGIRNITISVVSEEEKALDAKIDDVAVQYT